MHARGPLAKILNPWHGNLITRIAFNGCTPQSFGTRPMDNRLDRAAMFRKYAAQIRSDVEGIVVPEAQASALEVARYWDVLADRMEQRVHDDPRV